MVSLLYLSNCLGFKANYCHCIRALAMGFSQLYLHLFISLHITTLFQVSMLKAMDKEVNHGVNIHTLAFFCLFLGGAPTSICHFFCLSIHLFSCCTPYLRNHTSCNHNFWSTYVKWWYLLALFSFFQNFYFLGR